ncbi:hypothetical protein [Psychroserpens mesophilus]|uniref:hypothetical protein n=1 Tax=Psychroserpens mesophilus TaxID=325473 RepID=UPI003F490BE5
MEIKKDIGRAFEEHLTNLNESPDDLVWKNIEEELKKEKKHRYIIPIWLRYASIGAILVILILNRNNSPTQIKSNYIIKEEHQKTPITESSVTGTSITETPITVTLKTDKKNQYSNDDITQQNTIYASEKRQKKNIKSYSYSLRKEEKSASTYQNSKQGNNSSSKTINSVNHINTSIKNLSQSYSKLNIVEVDSQVTSNKTSELSKTNESAEEAIQKAENKHETEKDSVSNSQTTNKWSIYPNISLISYNGFNETFKDNISVNYGVLLKYHISEKGSLRFGVSKLDLQHTYEVDKVSITQEVSYIEIPLEFNYTLSKKKIQTSVIGGFSYFLITDAHQKSLNENNNLIHSKNKDEFNSSTMSFNLGVNFNTKIYNNFYLNIEPVLKYQLSPYTDSADYNPYLISISSGIEYKF